jgi:glycosyltransferase involved in cell wall biosynthesis
VFIVFEVWIDKHLLVRKDIRFTLLVRFNEWLNLHWATRIIVVSQVLRDQLIHAGVIADKIIVIPNGVDTNVYNSEKLTEQRAQLRAQLGLQNNFVFGFIGTFGAWHGVHVLADTITLVARTQPNARFLMIGDGPLRAQFDTAIMRTGVTHAVICVGRIA